MRFGKILRLRLRSLFLRTQVEQKLDSHAGARHVRQHGDFRFCGCGADQTLPYHDPGRLVAVFETTIMCPRCNVSYLNFRDWKFGVQPWDLPTLAAVAFVLGSSAIMASYIPARRAASVNPVGALRAE